MWAAGSSPPQEKDGRSVCFAEGLRSDALDRALTHHIAEPRREAVKAMMATARDRGEILLAIIDPNRSVEANYQLWTVTTRGDACRPAPG